MDSAVGQQLENNRARVRRILFEPVGFRFKRGMDAEAQAKYFAELADYMAYMSDESLKVLRDFMIQLGQGPKRDQWPEPVTMRVWAERAHPRPLHELSCLVSWFSSVEGPAAVLSGTLVETWDYLEQHKVPPATDGARRRVREEAREHHSRLERIEERIALDLPVAPDQAAWAQAYRDKQARVAALVERFRASKEAEQ
ncbi:hypothetical protein [Thioclava sp. GXIMD2076]|uniref:hypothetical protein n=1 Tax=Thioclava sp. GXIMD2076 TaxID=3131931 RepID=UPI0030CD4120